MGHVKAGMNDDRLTHADLVKIVHDATGIGVTRSKMIATIMTRVLLREFKKSPYIKFKNFCIIEMVKSTKPPGSQKRLPDGSTCKHYRHRIKTTFAKAFKGWLNGYGWDHNYYLTKPKK